MENLISIDIVIFGCMCLFICLLITLLIYQSTDTPPACGSSREGEQKISNIYYLDESMCMYKIGTGTGRVGFLKKSNIFDSVVDNVVCKGTECRTLPARDLVHQLANLENICYEYF